MNLVCEPLVSDSGNGLGYGVLQFYWYQSYGLVDSRTTVIRPGLSIHATMCLFDSVEISDS